MNGLYVLYGLTVQTGPSRARGITALTGTIHYPSAVWPARLGVAANILGVDVAKLRRWVREGRFDDVPGLTWVQNGFRNERRVTRDWVAAVGKVTNLKPDWKAGSSD